jgi:aspartyl-tRNA(Asn)/glutamyl-tRNA(Gln) amidotransferase subunit C
MAISRKQVEKVSLLGRLLLSEQELEKMTTQLGQILDYMDLLAAVDTDDVEPLAHPLDMSDVFRDDQVRPSLPRERALANAPNRDDQCYLVPAVLGELG